MQYVAVFITAPNKKEAEKVSEILLDKRVASCVNILGSVDSHFWWKGKKERVKEYLLIAKTTRRAMRKLVKIVKSAHSYDVPEIIAIPIIAGYRPYLNWIEGSVKNLMKTTEARKNRDAEKR